MPEKENKIRVCDLAKELGVKSKDILNHPNIASSAVLKGPRSVIADEAVEDIRILFNDDNLFENVSPQRDDDGTVETEVEVSLDQAIDLDYSYVAMDCRDLRVILSCGYLGPRESYEKDRMASCFDISGSWTVVSEENEFLKTDGIPVSDTDWACLVRLPDTSSKSFPCLIPASELKEVVFKTELQRKDFVSRNKSIRGFPSSQLEYVIEPKLIFVEQKCENLEIETNVSYADMSIPNRVSGAISAFLAKPESSESELRLLAESERTDRDLVSVLIANISIIDPIEVSDDEEPDWIRRINNILDVIAEQKWSDGFSNVELLAAIANRLSEWDENFANKLKAPSLVEILEARKECPPDLMDDEGEILLRGLLLLLRTNPLSLARLEEWKKVSPTLGRRVMDVATILTGWYSGFFKQDAAKESFPLYRLCCRSLVQQVDEASLFPPNLSIIETSGRNYSKSVCLCESNESLACATIETDPGILEAYYAMQQAASKFDVDFKLSLDPDNSTICLIVEGVEIAGSRLPDTGVIKWESVFELKHNAGIDVWSRDDYVAIAKISASSAASVYAVEFPKCKVHFYQLLTTMDHEEIVYHVNEIIYGIDRLYKEFN